MPWIVAVSLGGGGACLDATVTYRLGYAVSTWKAEYNLSQLRTTHLQMSTVPKARSQQVGFSSGISENGKNGEYPTRSTKTFLVLKT